MEDSSGTEFGSPATSNTGSHSSGSTLVKRRPIPRKGHTKSRAGCIVCKRRKVKCDEVLPQCGPCQRLKLDCQYLNRSKPRSSPDSMSLTRSLREEPVMFDKDDMMFFRHFLFDAYPTLPIDGARVWQQVSQLSHEYDFLLHAMLALGASHLGLLSNVDYQNVALKHRVRAIEELNQHLSNPNLSMPAGDAAFGAIMALTFQSAYMPDGMTDFLTMIRGCFLIGNHLMQNIERSTFKTFGREEYVKKISELVAQDNSDELLSRVVAQEYCNSLRRLGSLCRSVGEVQYVAHMEKIAILAVENHAESHRELSFFYDRMGNLKTEDFEAFIDPENYAARLVIMHILILDYVMSRKSVQGGLMANASPGFVKGLDYRKGMSRLWIEQINDQLPAEYHEYAAWPVNFMRSLTYSFNHENEVWKPFLLSEGTAIYQSEHTSGFIVDV